MKDKFDKEELRDTINKLDDFIMKLHYDCELYGDRFSNKEAILRYTKDLDLMDKVYDYLKELEDYYNG